MSIINRGILCDIIDPMNKTSAGILIYRETDAGIEFLLAHPGGPFWKSKDEGAWSILKGENSADEELLKTAQREFNEETGFVPPENLIELGSVIQKNGKTVYAWAGEGEYDVSKSKSNTFEMEWPPKSGKKISVPEIERVEYFDIHAAKIKINPAQAAFIDRLMDKLTL